MLEGEGGCQFSCKLINTSLSVDSTVSAISQPYSLQMERSLFEGPFKLAGNILHYTGRYGSKPYCTIAEQFEKLKNARLYFCGFSIILVPLIVGYWGILLGILLVELLVFLALSLLLALVFVAVGVLPALITSLGIGGVTIFRLPWMIYSHCLVTYRTVMLRANPKLMSFLLMPLLHLLIPPATFLGSLLVHLAWFSSMSFVGYPFKPWHKIPEVLKKFWEKYVTDMERLFNNYGHPSGIPQDWDGRVYGLPIDPIKIVTNAFLYIIALLPISVGTFVVFAIKAVPIFLGTLVELWKTMNIGAAFNWYKGVLHGTQPVSTQVQSSTNSAQPQVSLHDSWTKPLQKATGGATRFIENYANIKIVEAYKERLRRHWKRVNKLDPEKLTKVVKSYLEDFSPLKLVPKDAGAAWVILWVPVLLTSMLWILGFILVLTIPPLTFLLGFLLWTVAWLPVICVLPVLYVFGWVVIIFGLPSLYIVVWVLVLFGPWLFVAVGMVSGPILSLRIIFSGPPKNFFNPVEMWSAIKLGLRQIPQTLIRVDKFTGSLSLGKVRFSKLEPDTNSEKGGRVKIDYWDLFIRGCKEEATRIQDEGWLSEEDIQAASSTAVIAIPASTILTILERSVKKNKKDRTLILWNADTECRESTRDLNDNVANVFWPQIMQIKESVMVMKNLEVSSRWIKASLCDGEDEKSEQLARALEENKMEEEERRWCLKIRAKIENTVHSLLRVKAFNSRLPEILDTNATA